MGKKSAAPPPPDYAGLAKQQAGEQADLLNQNTWANRVDQTNPYGSQTWSNQTVTDPTTGKPVTKWTQNTTLNADSQRALTAQQATQANQAELGQSMMGRLTTQLGQPMDISGLQGWGNTTQAGNLQAGNLQAITNANNYGSVGAQNIDTSRMGGYGDYRGRAEDAIYKSATSRLDPQWDQRRQQMETQLANRGISSNSGAYTRAMADLERQRTDAYGQANMSAITGGGVEAQRNYSMDEGARNQQISAQNALQQQQLNSGNYNLAGQNQAFNQSQAAGAQNFGQEQQAGAQNFSQQMQQAEYQNRLRQQQLEEAMGMRSQGLNEMNALMGGSQVQMPQFGNYTQAGQGEAADIYGAAKDTYGAQTNAANMKSANQQQTMQTVGTVAAMF